jgi:hypothetical protein
MAIIATLRLFQKQGISPLLVPYRVYLVDILRPNVLF